MKNINKNCFNALRTGAGNYAYHQQIKDFSFGGQQEFTLEIYFYANELGNEVSLYGQKDVFEFGVSFGNIFFRAPGFCEFQTIPQVIKIETGKLHYIAISYNKIELSLYVNGLFIMSFPKKGEMQGKETEYTIGKTLNGYIRELRVQPVALKEQEIRHNFLNEVENPQDLLAWFDFTGTNINDKSKNSIPISVKGFSSIVNLVPVLSLGGNGFLQHDMKNATTFDNGYTLLAKVYPVRGPGSIYTIFSNADTSDESGLSLFLQKLEEDEDRFKLCCRIIGRTKNKELISDVTIQADEWSDVAVTFDRSRVKLYINGQLDKILEVLPSELTGGNKQWVGIAFTQGSADSRTAFNGYISHIAEFTVEKSQNVIAGYILDHPFIFDDGISTLYSFNDYPVIDSFSLKQVLLGGNAKVTLAVNTNSIDIEKGINYYFPTEESQLWKSLSENDKWRVEFLGTILEKYYRGICGMGNNDNGMEATATWIKVLTMLVKKIDDIPEIAERITLLSNQLKVNLSNKEIVELLNDIIINNHLGDVVTKVVSRGIGGITASCLTTFPAGVTACIGVIEANPVIASAVAVGAIVTGITIVAFAMKKDRPNPPPPDPNRSWINVKIISIEFNHLSDPVKGGIHIRQNEVTPIIPPEWNSTSTPTVCAKVAYVLNEISTDVYITIKAVMTASDDYPDTFNLKLSAKESLPSILGDLESGSESFTKGIEKEIKIKLTKNVIKDKGIIAENGSWYWVFEPISITYSGNKFIQNTFHTVYTLLELPDNPWVFRKEAYDNSQTKYPWTEALEIARDWIAKHEVQGKKLTRSLLAGYITMGLNGSGKFKYDKKSGASFYLSYGKLGPAFKIKKFINNYYGIDNYWLNCFDCAIIVSTFANLHGQISMQAKIRNPYGNDFECNQIISIGDVDTAWEVPFKQPDGKGYFSYHQIVFEKTLAVNLKDASTYDACLKVDGGEYPQQKNSVGKIALLPNDLLFSNNEKKEVSITEPYVDRTYRDRLVHNNSACWIHSILINWGFSFDMSDNIKNRYLEGYEAEQKMTDYFKELLSKIDVQEKTLTVFPIDLSFIKAWADQITVEHPDDRTALYRVKTDNLDIDIDYYLCKDIQSAHEQLYLMYNNIVSPKIISSVETNMKLGDIAFFSEENTSMILWSHSNIVIQILQNTTISADLFSIAKIINEQIEEKLRE